MRIPGNRRRFSDGNVKCVKILTHPLRNLFSILGQFGRPGQSSGRTGRDDGTACAARVRRAGNIVARPQRLPARIVKTFFILAAVRGRADRIDEGRRGEPETGCDEGKKKHGADVRHTSKKL